MRRPILPGATLGILGGGQLGRMTAMAARGLGYHVEALDPDPSCAARFVVDRCTTASFHDVDAAAQLASRCQVVTLEIEKVSVESLRAAAAHAPVRPGPEVLGIIQDRHAQKRWLASRAAPLGPWRAASTAEEVEAAARELGEVFIKVCQGGYDGGGQVHLPKGGDAKAAFGALGQVPVVVEQALSLRLELSVLVARTPSGEVVSYPPAQNHHEERILAWSVLPAPIEPGLATRAEALCRDLAEALGVEGLLVVELFVTQDGALLVNELAPRPHNSFHATEVACVTSQFEQHVRAVCDLPLARCEAVRPAAIVNLLGDLWLDGKTPPFDRALEVNGVRLHLYGKREARPRRKMGHLSAVGRTAEEAVERALAAYRALTPAAAAGG